MSGRRLLAIGSALAAFMLCASGGAELDTGSAASKRPQETLQQIVRSLVAAGAPGALVVVRTQRGIEQAASGLGNIKPRARMRSTDRYRIASVTKPFVATVVLQLAAGKRLTLTDSVERWLPGLVPNGRAITLRQLLNHTSGIFEYGDDSKWVSARFANPGREWSPRELVAVATSHPPLFAPGKGWSYSNTNYVLLGLVVEAVTGKPLGRVLTDRLFRPLALRSTSYPTGTAIAGRFAHGYVVSRPPLPQPAGTLIDASEALSPSAWGAGQIISSAADVTTFFASLLKGRLLPPALLKSMKTPVAGYDYGLGLVSELTGCGRAFGHVGDTPGYRNVVLASPNGRRVATIMVNIDSKVSWAELRNEAEAAFCSS